MTAPGGTSKLPRPLRVLGIGVAFILLTLTFVFFTFPYERLRGSVENLVGAATGAEVRIAALSPQFGLLGPGLQAESLLASWPDGARQTLDSAAIRPAWSLSWFAGTATVHLDIEGAAGEATGNLLLGDTLAWDGELRNLDASLLPIASAFPGTDLTGRIDADLSIAAGEKGGPPLVGTIEFSGRDGSLRIFDLPIALPYETLTGSIALGGDLYAAIESIALQGPMLNAELSGSIGAERGGAASLDLAANLTAQESAIRSVLRGYGVLTDSEGAASIHIGGTLARPAVQAAQ